MDLLRSINTEAQKLLAARLVELRHAAGIDQRELARRLDSPRSLVSRMEQGERRIDLIELYQILTALDADPKDEISKMVDLIDSKPPPKGKAGRVD